MFIIFFFGLHGLRGRFFLSKIHAQLPLFCHHQKGEIVGPRGSIKSCFGFDDNKTIEVVDTNVYIVFVSCSLLGAMAQGFKIGGFRIAFEAFVFVWFDV